MTPSLKFESHRYAVCEPECTTPISAGGNGLTFLTMGKRFFPFFFGVPVSWFSRESRRRAFAQTEGGASA